MRQIERQIVGAVIVSNDGKVFLAKDNVKNKGVYSGCWLIPGGGVEEGESDEQATIREVREETGLDISLEKLVPIDGNRTGMSEKTLKVTGEKVMCKMFFKEFLIKLRQNSEEVEITLSDEHSEYRWFNFNELGSLTLSPPSRELFTSLGYIK